ncbi:MAG: hypothetical protein LBP22_03065 [Deltaproteobacteria bacterium]|jgi:hypothetical protein|nr:hypothetical protein [Deltaproteobacteria bacterium]
MTIPDILFAEMVKNPDDLELFLKMHEAFPAFHRKTCLDFFNLIVTPGIEQKVIQYNSGHPGLGLSVRMPKNYDGYFNKAPDGSLFISPGTSSVWPEGIEVELASETYGLRNFYCQIWVPSAKDMPASETFRPAFVSSLIKAFRETFPSTDSIGSNDCGAWFYYGGAHRNLFLPEAAMAVSLEVANFKNGRTEPGPFAARYIQDVIDLVDLVDKFFCQTATGDGPPPV